MSQSQFNQKAVVFTDVDDTLLSSIGKISDGEGANPVATNKEGEFVGFSTDAQLSLIQGLTNMALIVPVTGRDKGTLYHYRNNWDGPQVVSHGALVLNSDGSVNDDWMRLIAHEVHDAAPMLDNVLSLALNEVEKHKKNDEGRSRIISDQGIKAYFCAKYRDSDLLNKIEDLVINLKGLDRNFSDWIIHRNGRNLAFLPPYASKVRAVKFIKEYLGLTESDLTIGIGDSESDLKFMHECKFCMYPSKSQIQTGLAQNEIV